MQAIRVIVETNEKGQIVELPTLSPSTRLEAIFLVLEEQPAPTHRQPPADIAGQGQILGDVVAPACYPADWNALG
jgi:hypothetical protein